MGHSRLIFQISSGDIRSPVERPSVNERVPSMLDLSPPFTPLTHGATSTSLLFDKTGTQSS